MTRKEEIEKASVEYQINTKPMCIGGDAFADMVYKFNINPSFIAGAEWADKTMIEKACEVIRHLLSGYVIRNFHFGDSYDEDTLIEDFKKVMEE